MDANCQEFKDLRIGFIGKRNEEQLAVITDQRKGSYIGTYVLPHENTPLMRITNPEISWHHEHYISEPWDEETLNELRETHQIALQFIQKAIAAHNQHEQRPQQLQAPSTSIMAALVF